MISRTHPKAFCASIFRSRHRGLFLIAMVASFCTAGLASGADLSQAVVRQKVNVVTLAPNLTSAAHPASEGAVIHDENVVRTGTESRAELEFTDLTLARLGSNSIFSFDAKERVMNFQKGAVLFSKPTNSGAIQLRSGAISGAITGTTGFISTVAMEGLGKTGHINSNGKGTTTIIGILEGKVQGGSHWTDSSGHEHTTPFKLGPGELLVSRPDGMPRMAQFDIPRFVKSSPLIKGFKAPLPNAAALDRAIADYEMDVRRGFVDQTNTRVSGNPHTYAFVGQIPLDVVAQLQVQNPGFLPVGSDGVIRGQLVWNSAADLDLHLLLPDGQEVSYRNVSITFNNGRAVARLDHDNLGNTIDVPPGMRVENIVISGIPLEGLYRFIVQSFNSPNGSDAYTLRVFYNGHLQVINGNIGVHQSSKAVVVQVPGVGARNRNTP
jgi:FecR protein